MDLWTVHKSRPRFLQNFRPSSPLTFGISYVVNVKSNAREWKIRLQNYRVVHVHLLYRIWRTSPILSYFFHKPPPPHCGRDFWMVPNSDKHTLFLVVGAQFCINKSSLIKAQNYARKFSNLHSTALKTMERIK